MANCRDIESQLTAYVDGETPPEQRARVEAHLDRCPPCRGRATTERTTHELLRTRRAELRGAAPRALHHRCAAQRALSAGRHGLLGRRTLVPLSLAATLVLATAVLLLFGWGSTVETYAAQLAADHMKCFQYPPDGAAADAAALGRKWQADYGWPLVVAAGAAADQLELLGVRRCGSTRGRVAHIFYRWRGEPVSVYVLNGSLAEGPDQAHAHGARDSVIRLGKHALIWSDRGRTYAVVARRRVPDLEHVADYVRRASSER